MRTHESDVGDVPAPRVESRKTPILIDDTLTQCEDVMSLEMDYLNSMVYHQI